jgi:hypothetical protein
MEAVASTMSQQDRGAQLTTREDQIIVPKIPEARKHKPTPIVPNLIEPR